MNSISSISKPDDDVLLSYSDFSVIYSNITSNDYSDEQKQEMMTFLTSQTKERQLEMIIKPYLDQGGSVVDMEELVIAAINNVKDAQELRIKELYLNLFDEALQTIDDLEPRGQPQAEKVHVKEGNEELKRKNALLQSELEILKEELEDKIVLLDKVEAKLRSDYVEKSEFNKLTERCNYLVTENGALRSQLYKEEQSHEHSKKEFKAREESLVSDMNALKDSIKVKGVLLKTFENEKEVMFTDFQLLSEEVVERDLIIQSLNEAVDDKENFAFLLEKPGTDSEVDGENLTSTAKNLQLPVLVTQCENCTKNTKNTSLSFLNVSFKRGRNVPSPIYDDSVPSSLNNSTLDPLGLVPAHSKVKSLGDELSDMNIGGCLKPVVIGEVNRVKRLDSEKPSQKAIVERLSHLENELTNLRRNLERTRHNVMSKSNIMIRYRVINGQLTKMAFTKYDGVKL